MLGVMLVLNLVAVTTTDGKTVFLNPSEIVTLRHPQGEHHGNAECIIYTADGHFVAIREYCETIESRIRNRGGS